MLSAGCLSREDSRSASDTLEARVAGVFSANATQADVAELAARVRERGGEMAVMESFPLQFSTRGLGEADCADVRAFAALRPYVASVGACVRVVASDRSDDSVASR